jgi:hypothetical protein
MASYDKKCRILTVRVTASKCDDRRNITISQSTSNSNGFLENQQFFSTTRTENSPSGMLTGAKAIAELMTQKRAMIWKVFMVILFC